MIGKTQRNQMPKKLHFFISYDVMLGYICAKEIYVTSYYQKMQIYSKNDCNDF
jgi:hypothetical protein